MSTSSLQHKVVSGLEFLHRLVLLAPDDSELRLRFAQELFESGDLGLALSEIREVLRRDPNNLPARELREAVYDRLPDHSKQILKKQSAVRSAR